MGGRWVKEALQAEPPSRVRPHAAGRRPHAGGGAAYVRRRRHPPLGPQHTCKQSVRKQPGSWAGGPGETPGGLVTSPPTAGVRTGWAEARTGPYRPYARGPAKKGGPEKGDEIEEEMRSYHKRMFNNVLTDSWVWSESG